jgi:hypothetical protein
MRKKSIKVDGFGIQTVTLKGFVGSKFFDQYHFQNPFYEIIKYLLNAFLRKRLLRIRFYLNP